MEHTAIHTVLQKDILIHTQSMDLLGGHLGEHSDRNGRRSKLEDVSPGVSCASFPHIPKLQGAFFVHLLVGCCSFLSPFKSQRASLVAAVSR